MTLPTLPAEICTTFGWVQLVAWVLFPASLIAIGVSLGYLLGHVAGQRAIIKQFYLLVVNRPD